VDEGIRACQRSTERDAVLLEAYEPNSTTADTGLLLEARTLRAVTVNCEARFGSLRSDPRECVDDDVPPLLDGKTSRCNQTGRVVVAAWCTTGVKHLFVHTEGQVNGGNPVLLELSHLPGARAERRSARSGNAANPFPQRY